MNQETDEYPSLATLEQVDLNYRLGGLLLDVLISVPLLALPFVPGMANCRSNTFPCVLVIQRCIFRGPKYWQTRGKRARGDA